MNKIIRLIVVAFLVVLLGIIRMNQTQLFYDPLLDFFANDALDKKLPEYNAFQMYANIIYRYLVNSSISVAILYLLFWNKQVLISSMKIYAVAGFLTLIFYIFLVETGFPLGETFTFYVRRILIQPLLLFILLPSFYLEQNFTKGKN